MLPGGAVRWSRKSGAETAVWWEQRSTKLKKEKVEASSGRKCVKWEERAAGGVFLGAKTRKRPPAGRLCARKGGWAKWEA